MKTRNLVILRTNKQKLIKMACLYMPVYVCSRVSVEVYLRVCVCVCVEAATYGQEIL